MRKSLPHLATVLWILSISFLIVFRASASGIEFSSETQDRRNQVGADTTLWSASAYAGLGAWEIDAVLSFDQRFRSISGFKDIFPISVRKDDRDSRYLIGYAHLPDWGYGRTGTLVLSHKTPPFVQADWAIGDGPASYEKLVGVLDFGAKYLFAHRLIVRPRANVELSAAEVSIASEKVADNPVNYIPGWPLYLSQHLGLGGIGNDDLNTNIALGGRWDSGWGLFYGDLFVDDMPQDPSHYDAYLIAGQGGYLRPIQFLERSAMLGVEYTRANNWMYSFRHKPYTYTQHGYILGHWIGPDSDLLDLSVAFPWLFPTDRSSGVREGRVEVSYQLLRHGEGKVGDVWEDYGTQYARDHSFLTGVVETSHTVGVNVKWPFKDNLLITSSGRLGSVFNKDNVKGQTGLETRFSFDLGFTW